MIVFLELQEILDRFKFDIVREGTPWLNKAMSEKCQFNFVLLTDKLIQYHNPLGKSSLSVGFVVERP